MDAEFKVGNLALVAEIVEHVGLRHRDIDLPQVEQIVQVGGGAVSDDRNDAQIVAVVEHLGELVGECHVGAGELSARDADRPGVPFVSLRRIAAALFQRLGYALRAGGRGRRAHKQSKGGDVS